MKMFIPVPFRKAFSRGGDCEEDDEDEEDDEEEEEEDDDEWRSNGVA